MIGRDIQQDIDVGQFADDAGQTFDRQSDTAAFLDFGLDLAPDAQIKIGGGKGNVIFVCLDQNIAQDRHRRFGADDVEDLGKTVAEVIAIDLKFHRGRGGVRSSSQTMDEYILFNKEVSVLL